MKDVLLTSDRRRCLTEAVRCFTETGRAVLPLAMSTYIPTVLSGVRRLIADPRRESWELYIPRQTAPVNDADDGLIRKNKTYEGETADNKWFFHFRPSLAGHLAAKDISIVGYEDLFEASLHIYEACQSLIEEFAACFDEAYPEYDLVERMRHPIARELAPLRVLAYDRGRVIARPHTDRDALTLQVAESRSGLRTGEQRTPYVATPNTALLFAGRKFEVLTGKKFRAMPHDVEDIEDIGQDAVEGRMSIVFFSHILQP